MKTVAKRSPKDFETWELEQELKRRGELVMVWSRMDVKTCCDQTKGLLTDRCVDDILSKYDVEGELVSECAELIQGILSEYELDGNKLEYD